MNVCPLLSSAYEENLSSAKNRHNYTFRVRTCVRMTPRERANRFLSRALTRDAVVDACASYWLQNLTNIVESKGKDGRGSYYTYQEFVHEIYLVAHFLRKLVNDNNQDKECKSTANGRKFTQDVLAMHKWITSDGLNHVFHGQPRVGRTESLSCSPGGAAAGTSGDGAGAAAGAGGGAASRSGDWLSESLVKTLAEIQKENIERGRQIQNGRPSLPSAWKRRMSCRKGSRAIEKRNPKTEYQTPGIGIKSRRYDGKVQPIQPTHSRRRRCHERSACPCRLPLERSWGSCRHRCGCRCRSNRRPKPQSQFVHVY